MSGNLTAVRTDCVSGRTREVTIGWEVRTKGNDERWLWLLGGPTGYESVCLDDYHKPLLRDQGWHACGGTPMGWDALIVPASEMNRVLDEIEEQLRIRRQLEKLQDHILCARDQLDHALTELKSGSVLGIRFGVSACRALLKEHAEPIIDRMTREAGERRRTAQKKETP